MKPANVVELDLVREWRAIWSDWCPEAREVVTAYAIRHGLPVDREGRPIIQQIDRRAGLGPDMVQARPRKLSSD